MKGGGGKEEQFSAAPVWGRESLPARGKEETRTPDSSIKRQKGSIALGNRV